MAKQPTQYDANILQVFVEDLYSQARLIIVTTTIKYAFFTFVAGGLFAVIADGAHLVDRSTVQNLGTIILVATVIAALIGVAVGRAKAWELKFKAQQLLLQMQIESNTAAVRVAQASDAAIARAAGR